MKLRKLFLKDAERLKTLFLQERNLQDVGVNVTHDNITLEYAVNWVKEYKKMYLVERPSFILYAIAADDNKILGTVGAGNIDYKKKSCKLGYWISNENNGKGYATLAVNLFLKKIGKDHKIKKIIAEVSKKNIASIKVLDKNNFELCKKLKNYFVFERNIN